MDFDYFIKYKRSIYSRLLVGFTVIVLVKLFLDDTLIQRVYFTSNRSFVSDRRKNTPMKRNLTFLLPYKTSVFELYIV